MVGGGKKGARGPAKGERKDRKSATGMSGEPKKGGHGGKFTWAGDEKNMADGGMENGALDARDPNYEDPEEEGEGEERVAA